MNWVSISVGVAVALLAQRAQGFDTSDVRRALDAHQSALTASEKDYATGRTAQEALAQTIAQQKAEDPGVFDARRRLKRLLKQSIASERALAIQGEMLRAQKQALKKFCHRNAKAIEREIRRVAPKMKHGPKRDRKQVAIRIQDLRVLRKKLRTASRNIQVAAPEKQRWSAYQVKVDPLDSPNDVREKADLVEDTKDKFKKKRLQLETILRELKEERELTELASAFAIDSRHFDESVRSQRVVGSNRNTNQVSTPSANREGTNEVPNDAAAPTSEGVPNNSAAEDVANDTTTDASPTFDQPTPEPPPSVTPPSLTELVPPDLVRDISPEVLLNLRVEWLEREDLDEATVTRVIESLAKMEHFLRSQAKKLRKQAEALQKEERR